MNVKGDGNCLFYAACVSLRPLRGKLPKQLRDSDQEKKPSVLRELVCNHLQDHPPTEDAWRNHLAADNVQADFRTRGLPLDASWQQYVNDMRSPRRRGGYAEIEAIGKVLRRKVMVLQRKRPHSLELRHTYVVESDSTTEPLCLFYDGLSHYGGLLEST